MNVRTKEYRKIAPDSAYSLRAQALCLDETGNVWIGTVGSGLVRYDVKNNRFYSVNDILRYDVSTIYSLCTDDDNDLWMGTDNGLFKYNIEKNTFFRFDTKTISLVVEIDWCNGEPVESGFTIALSI
mgnify:CR=1 FL=1